MFSSELKTLFLLLLFILLRCIGNEFVSAINSVKHSRNKNGKMFQVLDDDVPKAASYNFDDAVVSASFIMPAKHALSPFPSQ